MLRGCVSLWCPIVARHIDVAASDDIGCLIRSPRFSSGSGSCGAIRPNSRAERSRFQSASDRRERSVTPAFRSGARSGREMPPGHWPCCSDSASNVGDAAVQISKCDQSGFARSFRIMPRQRSTIPSRPGQTSAIARSIWASPLPHVLKSRCGFTTRACFQASAIGKGSRSWGGFKLCAGEGLTPQYLLPKSEQRGSSASATEAVGKRMRAEAEVRNKVCSAERPAHSVSGAAKPPTMPGMPNG